MKFWLNQKIVRKQKFSIPTVSTFLLSTQKKGKKEPADCETHGGSKKLKPAENKFTQSDFTNYSMQVTANSHNFRFRSLCALHIQNLSNRCRHVYDPSI
jgi:hypothetical protein